MINSPKLWRNFAKFSGLLLKNVIGYLKWAELGIKWKIVANKGKKCKVLEEHPLNCNVEAVFGKYGLPKDFKDMFGCWKDGEIIKSVDVDDDSPLKPLTLY